MKKFLATLLLVALLATTTFAGDWTGWLPTSDKQVDLWLTYTDSPESKMHLGPYLTWANGDDLPTGEDQFGAGIVAFYDILSDKSAIVVGDVSIPVQASIGLKAGVAWTPEASDFDPATDLITMLSFGDKKEGLFGIEKMGIALVYQYNASENLWDLTLPSNDLHSLLIAPYFTF